MKSGARKGAVGRAPSYLDYSHGKLSALKRPHQPGTRDISVAISVLAYPDQLVHGREERTHNPPSPESGSIVPDLGFPNGTSPKRIQLHPTPYYPGDRPLDSVYLAPKEWFAP